MKVTSTGGKRKGVAAADVIYRMFKQGNAAKRGPFHKNGVTAPRSVVHKCRNLNLKWTSAHNKTHNLWSCNEQKHF